MENKKYRAHALLLPVPGQGHINPMLQFSKRLASKNVRVTIALTTHIANSSTHQTHNSDNNNLVQIEPISDGFDLGGYAAAESNSAYCETFKEVGSRELAGLMTRLADIGHPVGAVVYDPHLPWALDVARRFGVVKVAFFTQSCAVSNVYYHVNRGVLGVPMIGDVLELPGLVPLRRSEVPSFVVDDPGGYLGLLVGQFDNIDEADWVLHNSFYELEPEGVDWGSKLWRLRTIGPLVPSMYTDKRLKHDTQYGISIFRPTTISYKGFLDKNPTGSVVYVSYGSLASPSADRIQELALALKQTNYNFLWVVRESEQPKLPPNFVAETAGKGLVVTWCDQLEVLAHDSVGCFVTHCGLNSIYEAMCSGVPMVAVPQWTDQCTNAKFVEDVWGIGLRAWADESGVLRRGELEMRIRDVMEGDKGKIVKKNVRKWMGLAREAVDEGGSSDKNIDEFVASL